MYENPGGTAPCPLPPQIQHFLPSNDARSDFLYLLRDDMD